jgi:outer membrane protein OmpA-like peptidoglycan-associated protein
MSWPGKSIKVDLMGLDRVGGDRVVARFRVTADQGSDLGATSLAASTHARDKGPSAAVLVDTQADTESIVLRTPSGGCLCSTTNGIKAGQPADVAAVFPAPPASVSRMLVAFPNTPPFLQVPLTTRASYPIPGVGADAASTPAAAPQVLPLINTVSHGKETDATSGGKVSARLSSDVLFDTDSATLSSTAQSLLKQVAGEIDKSSGSSVTVDGYADNTGSDSVNVPLSQHRADNVRGAIQKLVTRKGLQFSAKGHGSADPIADNSKPEGRALNRRVVITFTAPAQTPASRTVPPATGDPASQPNPAPLATVHAGKAPVPLLPWPKSVTLDVDGLIQDSQGFTVLTWTLHNVNKVPVPAGFATDLADVFRNAGPGRITLGSGADQYKNVEDAAQQAVFPSYSAWLGDFTVGAGKSLTGWNLFHLAPGVTSVTVQVPGFPAIPNVQVKSRP